MGKLNLFLYRRLKTYIVRPGGFFDFLHTSLNQGLERLFPDLSEFDEAIIAL